MVRRRARNNNKNYVEGGRNEMLGGRLRGKIKRRFKRRRGGGLRGWLWGWLECRLRSPGAV